MAYKSRKMQNGMNVLITGGSRGIGLGLVRHFLNNTNASVIATSRNPSSSSELQQLKQDMPDGNERLIILPLDISSEESVANLYQQIISMKVSTIDILIANASIVNKTHPTDPVLTASPEEVTQVFRTNCAGNLNLLQTFHPLISRSMIKTVLLMSSSRGSFTNAAEVGDQTSYRLSKAGLNMLGVVYAVDPDVRETGIKTILMHPGWVKTDMGLVGGQPANTEIDTSTNGILKILERVAVLQLQKYSNLSKDEIDRQFRFSGTVDEIEQRDYLNDFISQLYETNFAYVRFDGQMMNW